jgi:hypothetical protein
MWSTDGQTDRQTDRPTLAKQYTTSSPKGGIIINKDFKLKSKEFEIEWGINEQYANRMSGKIIFILPQHLKAVS